MKTISSMGKSIMDERVDGPGNSWSGSAITRELGGDLRSGERRGQETRAERGLP